MKKSKASSIILYVITAFSTAVGIFALATGSGLEWYYVLSWALIVILCVIDVATRLKNRD